MEIHSPDKVCAVIPISLPKCQITDSREEQCTVHNYMNTLNKPPCNNDKTDRHIGKTKLDFPFSVMNYLVQTIG